MVPNDAPKKYSLNLIRWPCLEDSEDAARLGLDPHGGWGEPILGMEEL